MKNISKISIFIMAVLFTACQENAVDDLTGKYPPPTDYPLTKLFVQQSQKVGSNRIFTLKIATDSYSNTSSGNYISIDFVGKSYFLESGAYSIAGSETAKAGNYIAGYDTEMGGQQFTNWGTCFFDVNNGAENASKVIGGTLAVGKNENHYTLSGVLALNNGQFIRINFAGEIVYEPDPYNPTYTYSAEVTAPYTYTMDGTTFIAVPGTQLNKISVKADGEQVAYLEIVTEENPTSLSGVYPVKNVTENERALCQGQFMNLLWFGMFDMAVESGSYLVGDPDKMFIRGGTLTITDNGGTFDLAGTGILIQDVATQMQFGTLPTPENFSWQNAKKEGVEK